MKKTNILILFLAIGFLGYSQNSEIENNIIKYWNYRNRLINNFISIGSEAGQSLPFATRNERGQKKLSQGQGPIMLGQYIGVLATEYKLLKQNNSNTEQTLKELYFALYAFNRLDLVAETVNGYNKKPKLDGFFIREDYPDDFVKNNPNLNKNIIIEEGFIYGSGKTFKTNCTTHKGQKTCDVYQKPDCSVAGKPSGYATKYNHKPMSMDQILGVLVGVALVNELVDEQANYQNKKLQDGEKSLKKEAQNIAKRMLSYAKKYNWTPKEPDGDYTGDCDFRSKNKPTWTKNNTTMLVFARFFSHIGKNIFGEKYSYTPLIGFLDGVGSIQADNFKGDFWNRVMYLEMITLSNKNNHLFLSSAKKVKSATKKYDWQPYYYALGIILHHWKNDTEIQKQSLEMLSSAPYDGPFFHGVEDFAKNGWASENRFSASLGEQYNGSRFPEITGNYSGLDYMLLHNMFLLTSSNKTNKFGGLKLKTSKNIQNKNFILNTNKCVQNKMQSCKERKKYLIFLKGLRTNNCKKSKAECEQEAIKYLDKKFNHLVSPNMKCSKSVFRKICEN